MQINLLPMLLLNYLILSNLLQKKSQIYKIHLKYLEGMEVKLGKFKLLDN